MKRFWFECLWQGAQWIEPALVRVDDRGIIQSVEAAKEADGAEKVMGWALPGVPNSHSHAFQFAMAGLTENLAAGAASDDFWSWREAMYDFALHVTPEETESIAAYVYSEMAVRGFTSVAEFHYLHHQPDGTPYREGAPMAEALCRGATAAGVRLTLVPVYYRTSDFGKPASPRQKRFVFSSADAYLKYADACGSVALRHGHSIGGGVHSLRASPVDDTRAILRALPRDWPRHLHVAEQTKEVEASLSALGKRPVEWLLDSVGLDSRFHLVHATHVTDSELTGVAASGANVILCPSTEGNLGDGIFPLARYRELGGHFSIGTDSHIGIDPWEELRWADYVQRLHGNRRNPLCHPGEESGEVLLANVVKSGNRAMGMTQTGFLGVGDPLDVVVVPSDRPLAYGLRRAHRVSTQIFAGGQGPLVGTMVGGKWIARHGRHEQGERLAAAAKTALLRRRP